MKIKSKFDDMIIDISTSMIELQMSLARFVYLVLDESEEKSYKINISIPFQLDDDYINIQCKKIYFDPEDEIIKIRVSNMKEAILWSDLNITAQDLDYVGFYEKPLLKFERVLYQHLDAFPLSIKTFLSSMPSWIKQKLRIQNKIRKIIGYQKDILFVQHHLAHAASCFLPSPFKKAAISLLDLP